MAGFNIKVETKDRTGKEHVDYGLVKGGSVSDRMVLQYQGCLREFKNIGQAKIKGLVGLYENFLFVNVHG